MPAIRKSIVATTIAATAALPSLANACDLCAVYAADQANGRNGGGLYVGLSEQFTRYDNLRDNGDKIADPARQFLDSSITQFLIGYGFNKRFSIQLSVPYIDRTFRRPVGETVPVSSVSGLGDLSLIGQFTPWRYDSEDWTISTRLLGGFKFPTGDSQRISEELTEDEGESPIGPSGIHGHDLALGSGSIDYVFGGDGIIRYGLWTARANLQYALRTRGDFDYRFGNDVQWSAGLGRYLALEETRTLVANVNVSGEYKSFDRFQGSQPEDTQSRILFIGPGLTGSLQDAYSLDLRADFPIKEFGSSVQVLPSYRFRLSFIARF